MPTNTEIPCIYVLEVSRRYKWDKDHPRRDERRIGWFSTLESAVQNLHDNKDIFAETVPGENGESIPDYRYALIEKVYEGPYSCGTLGDTDDVMFFEWKDGDYVEMERPRELQGVVGFTMG